MPNKTSLHRIALTLLIIFAMGRNPLQAEVSQRLNEHWEFLRQDLGGVWEAVRPLTKTGPENVPVWQPVTLPHCYNAEDAVDTIPNYYQGPAWYRTQLAIDNPYRNGRTLLHFEGAGQKTEVYVYTRRVATHTGGYDEFTVDITAAVDSFRKTEAFQKQFGGHIPISIRTDNSRDLEMIPSDLSDFMIYGGLYRYVNLVYAPPVSIGEVLASASPDRINTGSLAVRVRLYNPGDSQRIAITTKLFDPAGKLISTHIKSGFENDTIAVASFKVANIRRWSPERPERYRVEVSATQDGIMATKSVYVGFRSFQFVDKGPFLLNGQRLLLRGTHRHEDAAGVGAALTEEMTRRELLLIKAMGANFIRLGHYQQSPIVLDLCDSLGLLVWEEIPWCRGGVGGPAYREQARTMLSNMIHQHYNHPSIIIWGLGNENDWPGDQPGFDREGIRSLMRELNELAHRLDTSRHTAIRRCDFCRDIVDVYSPTIWMGWYRGFYSDYKQVTADEMNKVPHFLHAEWGGDSHAGRHSEELESAMQLALKAKNILPADSAFSAFAHAAKNNDWSETYICDLFDWHLKEQETMPWLTGSAFWTFKDFATPLRPENPVPYVNQKGVVERDGTIKESYYVFQSYWSAVPMAHIYGHSWPVRWGAEGEEKLVKVYSNCADAELFVNGKSYGVRKRNSQDYPAAGLRWNVVFNTGSNNIKVRAHNGKTIVTDEITINYQTEKWGKPAKLVLEKTGEKDGITTVQLRLVDNKGRLCLDAANTIRFGSTGDGKLLINQGTAGGSGQVQLANGRASVRVQAAGGSTIVSARAEGLPTVFIQL